MRTSLLFGSKLKVIATVVGLLAFSVGGSYALGLVGAPSVTGVENRFGAVTNSTTAIESDLHVSNPNPIGVNLGGTTAEYTVSMNDVEMAHGVKDGISIPNGNSSLHFSTTMQNEKIPAWWTSHIENGEHTDLVVDATVHSSLLGQSFGAPTVDKSIDTDIIGEFNSTERRPINANQPFVNDPVAYIERTNASWGQVSEERTPIDMAFTIYNPKSVPLTITEVGYDITMNGVEMGQGASERSYVIPPGGTETVETTTVMQNQHLDEWWVTHLENEQVTDLRIDFYAKVDLSAFGGGTVRIPLNDLTYTKQIETDFFGTKNATASTEDASATGTTTAEGSTATSTTTTTTAETTTTTTADGSEDASAETQTPTPTPTTTPTETTTDDGGLVDLPVRA